MSTTENSSLLYQRERVGDGDTYAAVVTMNRPDALNAMDWDMILELDKLLDVIVADKSNRALLITGNGRAFSAGGDLKKYIELQRDPIGFPQFVKDLHRVFGRLRQLPMPAVALVNGVTAAGGLELLINCDFAIAANSAKIGDGHLNFGQMGGGGVLTLLPKIIGLPKASELIFSGRFLSAQEAAEWGLVNRVVADDQLLATGLELAAGMANKSPYGMRNAKQVLNSIWLESLPVESGLRWELDRNAVYCLTSEDAPEGLQAFAEKRKPNYKGK
jgi:enoyl-CoA hydratase/carnithine racemase